jgi:SAM-dependent methyltransferase
MKMQEISVSRLDVGCGHRACGSVNVDPYPKHTIHRTTPNGEFFECKTVLIPNFVQADSQHLPFRDSVFDEVFSSNVIEHVPNPELMVREMVRVSRDRVVVVVPHRYGHNAKQEGHIHYFSNKWFLRVIKKIEGVYNWDMVQSERGLPFGFFGLVRVPDQITLTLRVKK